MQSPEAQTTHADAGSDIAPGGYDKHETDALLRIIGSVSGVQTVRTDRFEPAPIGQGNPMRIIIETADQRKFRMGTATHLPTAPIGHIIKHLKVDPITAREVLGACTRLSEINPIGAWLVDAAEVPAMPVTRTHVGERPLQPNSYLANTREFLAEDLPLVGRIEFAYLIRQMGQKSQRRAFMRFLGKDGVTELASIDAAGIALHARQQILKPDDEHMLELNLWRMRQWATQLGTDPDTLAETFPTLVFITSSLHLTAIDLH